jgi:rSAM/selenodomain-associated transferase 1
MRPAVVVMTKAPVTGRVKTRLCPPCTHHGAAALAEAGLRDTLAAVAATPGIRPVVALDGEAGAWLPTRFEIVAQRGTGLAARLGAAVVDVGGPVLVIGSDTPQVTPELLTAALRELAAHDAVFGPATDGGFWAIGLQRANAFVFPGVPMSEATTGAAQRARLRTLGLRTALLPALRDVDRYDDALAVAAEAPATCFATAVAALLGADESPPAARQTGVTVAPAIATPKGSHQTSTVQSPVSRSSVTPS